MSNFMHARFPGTCEDCEQPIDVGDAIRRTEDGYVHEFCEFEQPSEKPEPEPCTTCWLTHPKGACDR